MNVIEHDLVIMSLCIFLPSVVALALVFFPKGSEEAMRWTALAGTAFTFVVSAWVFIDFHQFLENHPDPVIAATRSIKRPDIESTSLEGRAKTANDRAADNKQNDDYDVLSRYPWIPRFNIEYFLGIDGISMPLVLLTTVLFVLSMIASWGIEKHVKGYCMLFLILETGVLGTLFALDFFLFYIFWEVMLFPMYFLIGIWGGPRREYAAIKFFLYTLFGSVFILIAMLAFYFTDVQDFVHKDAVEQARDEIKRRDKRLREMAEAEAKKDEKAEAEGKKDKTPPTKSDLEALDKVKINSFDLVVLARAGQGAMRWLALEG